MHNITSIKYHHLAFGLLRVLRYIPLANSLISLVCRYRGQSVAKELFGVRFKNPIGIAGGLDRKGEYYNDLSMFGPGFVEVGPIRNVRKVVRTVLANPPKGVVICMNIGGRFTENYLKDFMLSYDCGDVLCITVPLEGYKPVIDSIFTARRYNDEYKPMIVKLMPQTDPGSVADIVKYSLGSGADGIETPELFLDEVLEIVGKSVPVIAVADLATLEDATRLFNKGVSLIALSSGLLRNGPLYIKNILKQIDRK